MLKLTIEPLAKTVQSLKRAVDKHVELQAVEFVRDACVHRFKNTFDYLTKILRRYFELTESNVNVVEKMTFPTLIRTASERGLLKNDWSTWENYREKRNITSHTYNENLAKEVVQVIPGFLLEAQFLLNNLTENSQNIRLLRG